MISNQARINSLIAGAYTWLVSIFFGATLLDAVYAGLLPEGTPAFSEAADFLLLTSFAAILGAIGAVVFSWNSKAARYYFTLSLLVLLFEFIIPVFASQLMVSLQNTGLGTTIRITIHGLASILAFIGLYYLGIGRTSFIEESI